jgi:hypothetical protein
MSVSEGRAFLHQSKVEPLTIRIAPPRLGSTFPRESKVHARESLQKQGLKTARRPGR